MECYLPPQILHLMQSWAGWSGEDLQSAELAVPKEYMELWVTRRV